VRVPSTELELLAHPELTVTEAGGQLTRRPEVEEAA
jgi:hypothetical protein